MCELPMNLSLRRDADEFSCQICGMIAVRSGLRLGTHAQKKPTFASTSDHMAVRRTSSIVVNSLLRTNTGRMHLHT